MRALIKYQKILPICVLALMLLLPVRAWAAEPIDITQTGELTVYFTREEAYPGVEFRLYQVATIDAECNYTLTEAFAEANVVLENPTADDWRNLVTTFSGYVAGSGIEPNYQGNTNNNGVVTFADLPLGLYLVEGDSYTLTEETQEITVTPTSFLIHIPDLNENDEWNYSVEANCKHSTNSAAKKIDIEVQKIWKDNNYSGRPSEVVVELYAGDVLYDTVTLNKDNNWKYTWTGLSADVTYKVKEKEVPSGYTVVVEQQGNNFIVNNTRNTTEKPDKPDKPNESDEPAKPDDPEDSDDSAPPSANPPSEKTPTTITKLPQTGVLWWPVWVLVIAGVLLIVLGVMQEKGKKYEE